MSTATIVLGIVLIVAAVFLIIAVLMQQGKSHNLSGTIAGGAETFLGKSKAKTINKKLSLLTSAVAVVFVLIVVGFYVTQTPSDYSSLSDYFKGNKTEAVDTSADTSADTASDTTSDSVSDSAEG